MYHYTYYSYEQYGRGYIGSRTCKCNPEQDVNYFGSYTDKTFKPTDKIILEVYNTAKESMEAENALMVFYAVHKNPHFANKQLSAFRPGPMPKGRVRPKEESRKAAETLKKYYSTPEAKEWCRERMTGKNNPMYGKTPWNKGTHQGKGVPKSAKHKAALAAANRKRCLGKSMSEEQKQAISRGRKGKGKGNQNAKKDK